MKASEEEQTRKSGCGKEEKQEVNPESQERETSSPSFFSKQQNMDDQKNLDLTDYEAFFFSKKKNKGEILLPISHHMTLRRHLQVDPQIHSMSALQYTRIELIQIAAKLISKTSFAQSKIKTEKINSLVKKIAEGYNSVSYHNFSHGFTLMQLFYGSYSQDAGIKSLCNDEDLTLYLIAALTHDINHQGTNNGFEIKMKSQLAAQANNEAVLEKMHARTFFSILKNYPEVDILENTSNYQESKELILKAILATDMAGHFDKLEKLKGKRKNKTLNLEDPSDKQLILGQLFHACDIGNATFEFSHLMNWSCLLMEEFDSQTKLEEINQVQVTGFLKYQGEKDFLLGQSLFLGKFVLPLWKQLSVSFLGLAPYVSRIEENSEKFRELGNKIEDQKEKERL